MLVYNERTININEIFNINSPFSIIEGNNSIAKSFL